jgi:hypothetical protein
MRFSQCISRPTSLSFMVFLMICLAVYPSHLLASRGLFYLSVNVTLQKVPKYHVGYDEKNDN